MLVLHVTLYKDQVNIHFCFNLLGVKPEPAVIPGLTPSVEMSRGIDLEYEPEGMDC